MKKWLALSLCLLTVLSLCSCDTTDRTPNNDNKDQNQDQNQEQTEIDQGTPDATPPSNGQYYKIEQLDLSTVRYSIYDAAGNVVLTEQTDRPLTISMPEESLVDICIGMGTGISIHQYYDVASNRFSDEFSYVADTSGNLLAYVDVSRENSITTRKLVVRDIFDESVFYKEFPLDLSPSVDTPIEKAEFTEGEQTLRLAYLTEVPAIQVTETLPIRTTYEERQECYLVYRSNGNGACTVSAKGNELREAVIPATSPFGDRVTALGNMCFYGAKDLQTVSLPNSIRQIGANAFEGCEALEAITFEGVDEQWNQIEGAESLSIQFQIVCTSIPHAYRTILETYATFIDACSKKFDEIEMAKELTPYLGLIKEENKELLNKIATSALLLHPGLGKTDRSSPHYKSKCGYAIKDLNGDGVDELVLLNDDYTVVAILSLADGKPVLLDHYKPRRACWIDGDGLLHVSGSNGAVNHETSIYEIADGGTHLNLQIAYGTCEQGVDHRYELTYYKIIDGQTYTITKDELDALYATYRRGGAEETMENSGLRFVSLFDEAEIAKETYEAVLNNEVKVYDTDSTATAEVLKYKYLGSVRTPYTQGYLWDARERLTYAYVDMDGDGIDELLLHCSDTIVLRYYQGTVYSYGFTFRNMDHVNTDGSHSWNHTGQNFEYGAAKLTFDGTKLVQKILYRIVNDGEPDAQYYIGETQVTQEELLRYLENNPKTRVEFSPLTLPNEGKTISEEEALAIASQYWGIEDGATDYGLGSTYVTRIVLADEASINAKGYYYVVWKIEDYCRECGCLDSGTPHYVMKHGELLINAITGAYAPYELGGKG